MPNRAPSLRPAPCFAFTASLALLAACGGAPPPAAADATSVTASQTAPAPAAGGSAILSVTAGSASAKAERRANAAWAPCHSSFKVDPKADVAAAVDQLAKGCIDTTKMHMLDSFKGAQAAANLPQSFAFHAEAGHCYRAYAVAAPGIQDLDLLIKDSAGAVAGEDSTDDPTPVVQEDGAVCFKAADQASVVVSIGAGAGAYAVQVWSD
jgi:hypothetical protein